MAVTGLPNPDDAHAVHMARFAYQCLVGMKDLTRELEAMLGPGTSELALRVGLHSGPVTAGVLRGEKSRFQLFGGEYRTLFERLLPFGAWL
jgi:class 3 adenylate cyclase